MQYKICYKGFKCFYISYILALVELIKLLFGSRLQLLCARLKSYRHLIKLSPGLVYCCARGFRAGYCLCCVLLFCRCINTNISGPGNAVGIATDYGMDGPGSNLCLQRAGKEKGCRCVLYCSRCGVQ